jgi:broad specificity phosphatase PhoE
MRVHAVRHGQSEYNLLRLCNDDPARPVPLTALGRAQAADAGAMLAGRGIEIVYSSPLPRARETAAIVGEHVGASVITDARLADIRSGCEGRPVAEYQAMIAHDPLHARPNGGESLLDYRERIVAFLDWLAARPHAAVALVAHEETLRVFKGIAEGLPPEAAVDLAFGNCEVYAFELRSPVGLRPSA